MVYRLFVEKKQGFQNEANSLKKDLITFLGIKTLQEVRVINRYDVENIDSKLFESAKTTVFAEPQVDNYFSEINSDGARVFAVEFLPGQFDQRADSCSQCLQIIAQIERPCYCYSRRWWFKTCKYICKMSWRAHGTLPQDTC